jgi:hypothetical protein
MIPGMVLRPELAEKLILLAATAVLSGFLVPYILKRIELQRATYEKDRDADRSRQEKLIASQSEFLDKLTETVWQWRYMAVRLTYYGGGDDTAQYDNAARAYAGEFWPVLHALRVEISKSYRLVSADMLDRLKSFYQEVVKIDLDLQAIASELDPFQKRILYMDMNHRLFHCVSDDIDHLLEKIAGDLHLAKDQRR